jgi:hypothetical protein
MRLMASLCAAAPLNGSAEAAIAGAYCAVSIRKP